MLAPLPPEVLALLATQRGVITRRQFLAHAVSDRVIHRLRTTGVLVSLRPGVYAERAAWSDADRQARHCMRLLAAQLQAADAVAEGPSAATASNLPVRRVPARPHVIRSAAASPLTGVVVTRSHIITPTSGWVTVHAGIRVTVMAKTAIDVAAKAPFADALGTVDAALRRGVQPEELQEALRLVPPVSGVAAARLAVSFGDPYAETWLESVSRGLMLERRMRLPLSNVEIHSDRRWARVDFLLVEQGVVGEADGTGKYRDTEGSPGAVIIKERDRQAWLEDLGFGVARWGTEQVAGRGEVMAHRMMAAERRARLSEFRWPAGVVAKVPLLEGAPPPPQVVLEVERLAAAGWPIWFTDTRGRRVSLPPSAA
jgi:hypothetical protein